MASLPQSGAGTYRFGFARARRNEGGWKAAAAALRDAESERSLLLSRLETRDSIRARQG